MVLSGSPSEGGGCARCGQSLPARHRRYCIRCSPLASTIWKRCQRIECAGSRYWLDSYLKRFSDMTSALAAYREDCRIRMARSRAKRRAVLPAGPERVSSL